jgi:hypothetical protein
VKICGRNSSNNSGRNNLPGAGLWILDTGCSILDARYSMLDAGYSILATGHWKINGGRFFDWGFRSADLGLVKGSFSYFYRGNKL